MLKSYGVVVVVGGPCYYIVSPSPFGLDFGTWDFGTWDSGLTKIREFLLGCNSARHYGNVYDHWCLNILMWINCYNLDVFLTNKY